MRARVEFFDTEPTDTIVQQLRTAGIDCLPSTDQDPGTAGVLMIGANFEAAALRLRFLRAEGQPAIVVATAHIPAQVCWTLLELGAHDVVLWKDEGTAAELAARLGRWETIDELVQSPAVRNGVAGSSFSMGRVLRRIIETAHFSAAAVLLTGQSGTGKELMARLIHTFDRRPDKRDLIVVDCSTLAAELSGSELFGHERGAYTGATDARQGAFAAADGGTLFLDEAGEIPLRVQAQLLRAIQEQTYKPVGSNRWRGSSFRLVCATNRDLRQDVERGLFRADLYYRIAACTFRLPSLAERTEDILPLVEHFCRILRGGEPIEIDQPVRHFLATREYPGNVRDLRQLATRILARHTGNGPITVGDVPEEERPASGAPVDWRDAGFESAIRGAVHSGAGLKEIGRAAEEAAVRIAVTRESGNLQRAASTLGVTSRALQLRKSAHRVRQAKACG